MRERAAPNPADYAAPTLILLAPFLHYLEHHGYGLLRLESLLIVLPMVVLGLIVSLLIRGASHLRRVLLISTLLAVFLNLRGVYGFFEMLIACAVVAWLLREHLTTVLTAGFAVLIASTYLFSTYDPNRRTEFTAQPMSAAQQALPPVLHLVLDEHIGVEGIPHDIGLGGSLKAELKSFYAEHGFALQGGAYSQYFKTYDSLSNLFNFTSEATNSHYFPKGSPRDPYVMERNRYFAGLAQRGYRFRTYQSDYMDYCGMSGVEYLNCSRYGNTIKVIENMDMALSQKVLFIVNSYLRASSTARYLRKRYRDLRLGLVEYGIELPRWYPNFRIGILGAQPILQQLRDDLRNGANGTVFFAHLLLPHYPYVFNPDCSINNRVTEWWRRMDEDVAGPRNNSPESWAARYERYLVQIRCQQGMLAEIFQTMREAGVFDQAIIVVHGDHGSRISIHDPLVNVVDSISTGDIVDHYSTMFAVKHPQIPPGYSAHLEPLQNLLARVMQEPAPVTEDFVYLLGKRHSDMPKRAVSSSIWSRL